MTSQDYERVILLSMKKMDDAHEAMDDDCFDVYVDSVKRLEYFNQWLRGYFTALRTLGNANVKNILEFNSVHKESDKLAMSLLAALKELGLI